MSKIMSRIFLFAALLIVPMLYTAGPAEAYLVRDVVNNTARLVAPGETPDYLTTANWAYTPTIRKFVDPLPGLCNPMTTNCDAGYPKLTTTSGKNIPLAIPDIVTYPGSDYYEIELVEFQELMHSDLYDPASGTGYTTLRGYRQVGFGTDTTSCVDPMTAGVNDTPCTVMQNTVDFTNSFAHYLGPVIVAQKDRPVRVKFINKLGTGPDGDLFVPVDQSIMGSGEYEVDYDPVTKEILTAPRLGKFAQNRGELHLHGGRTPWISDGTPHQWITPAGEDPNYPQGVSVVNVSDMPIPEPNSGVQTYYWTNQQSARLMFYHDHAWGITRLNVYVGEAAGYVIQDETEKDLLNRGILPADEIPLVVQDKSYVDATLVENPYDPTGPKVPAIYLTDPTWRWGTGPVIDTITEFGDPEPVHEPRFGGLWWPHVYMPAQNPFDPTGIAPMGRWAYGPYFWPATNNPEQPIPNPYYNPACDANDQTQNEDNTLGYTTINGVPYCQPPEIPSSPNPSWGAEAFMDTPTVNGTAYPVMNVDAKAYRLRFLNAAHDRFFNLQMYVADSTLDPNIHPDSAAKCQALGGCATNSEVRMVDAAPVAQVGYPDSWPKDGRDGGVPDYTKSGPDWVMIASEGGFLPQPVVIPQQPVNWNVDVTTFNAGNVNAGSLILAPAERADVVVDFSAFAGKTLILYNDAPAPWPALDPHYDYYTGAPDLTEIGGYGPIPPGLGPNTRTIMKIVVSSNQSAAYDLAALQDEFNPSPAARTGGALSVFEKGQDQLIVGQGNLNPGSDPALYEAFIHDDRTGTLLGGDYSVDHSAITNAYNPTTPYPTTWPNWGLAQINDKSINFVGVDGNTLFANNPADNTTHPLDPNWDMNGGIPLQFKAIQDEQGETFDDYGRMRAALGIENIAAGAGVVNFVLQTYSDPPTEILEEDSVQVWKITHNGVDTHPVHFHLYDIQVLNRVGWDGFLRLPDPTELGWKDTLRISPLEDTIVALKPVTPKIPFGVPQSVRPLNPAKPLGDITELTQIDPFTGAARANLNRMEDLDWEYVWHCHILSHEENDMMRPQSFLFQEFAPLTPTGPAATADTGNIVLTWTDPTPWDNPATFGHKANEIGFYIYRSEAGGAFTLLTNTLANATSYVDTNVTMGTQYVYYLTSYNAFQTDVNNPTVFTESADSSLAIVTTPEVVITSPLEGTVVDNSAPLTITAKAIGGISSVNFYYNTLAGPVLIGAVGGTPPYSFDWTNPPPGTYALTAAATDLTNTYVSPAVNVTITGVVAAPATLNVPVTGPGVGTNTISWDPVAGTSVSYTLEQSADNFATAGKVVYSGTGTSTSVAVHNDGTYSYRVSATDTGLGTSPWTSGNNDWVVSIPVTTPVLTVPATSNNGSYTVSWTASPTVGATYVLQESATTDFTGAADIPVVGLSRAFLGKINGTYYYRLKAVNPPMADSAWTATKSILVGFPTSAPASITVPVRSTTGGYTISWPATTTPGAATYTLEESTSADFTAGVSTVATGIAGLSHTFPAAAKASGTYYYRVKATAPSYTPSPWRTGTNGVAILRTTITSPTSGAGLVQNTPVSLTATATTPTGYVIDTIEYYDGGTLVGFSSTGPDYSVSFTPTVIGSSSLTALTYYTNGASSPSPAVPFTVTGTYAPPVLTSPLSNAVYPYGATVNLAINPPAAIANATVNYVGYFNGAQTIGFSSMAPYSTTWTPVSAGAKSITAVVYYSNGVTATSTVVPISVGVGITTATLPSAGVGAAYYQTLTGGGGTAPFTWSAYGLPAGLSINPSTGAISGTPTAANIRAGSTYADIPVSIYLKDSTGASYGKVLFIRVN